MKPSLILPLVCSLLIAPLGTLGAQSTTICGPLQVTVSPNPAVYGQAVAVAGTNITASTINLPTRCLWTAVHKGPVTGPIVKVTDCAASVLPIAPGETVTQLWFQKDDAGLQVDPGTYTFEINAPTGVGPCSTSVVVPLCTAGTFTTFGAGCGTGKCFDFGVDLGPLVLVPETCPEIGTTFVVGLTHADCEAPAALILGASTTAWGAIPLPFDLGGGCLMHVSLTLMFGGATDNLGHAAFPMPIPDDPSLVGLSAYMQGGTFKNGILKVSNAVAVVVG